MIWRVRLEWKLADLWVGAFWKTTHFYDDEGRKPFAVDLWICLVPCVPIHVTFYRNVTLKFDP